MRVCLRVVKKVRNIRLSTGLGLIICPIKIEVELEILATYVSRVDERHLRNQVD